MKFIDNLLKMILIAALAKAGIFGYKLAQADVERQQAAPVIQGQLNRDNTLYLYSYYCSMNGVNYSDAGDAVLVNQEGQAVRACWQYDSENEEMIIMYSDYEVYAYDASIFN